MLELYLLKLHGVIMEIKESYSLDDVLIKPKYSTIISRSNIDVSVTLGNMKYNNPIIPANMKTIMSHRMAEEICKNKGLAILHRFDSLHEQLDSAKYLIHTYGSQYVAASIGVQKNDYENIDKFINVGVKLFCIDVAHGHSKLCVNMIKNLKNNYHGLFVIAGNVATESGAHCLWSTGADVVKCGIGAGCLKEDTRILMSNGTYKNIIDVIPGDYVINKNGQPVKVLKSFCTGIKKVKKLRNNHFYKDTFITPNHQMWVGDLNSVSKITISNNCYAKILDKDSKTIPKQSKYKWKKISDIKQDVLLFPKNINFNMPNSFKISLNKKIGGNKSTNFIYKEDFIIKDNYESGYMFGTFLGDGNALSTEHNGSHIGAVNWYFGLNEKNIVDKLNKCLKSLFNKEASIEIKNNIYLMRFYYKPLADFLNTFNKKNKKHLPENLLVDNKEYLKGLYDGLMDSDGHYAKDGRHTLSNTSTEIIELFSTIQFILNGTLPNLEKKKITAGSLKKCKVENCNQPYQARTMKNGKVRLTNNYQVVKILDISDSEIEIPVYDLEVDCESHSFIADNMIVHNSLCTTRIETANGVPQLTALIETQKAQQKLKLENPKNNYYFISDGGSKNSGDCIKALCFSDFVMLGNVFAGCEEAPGNIVNINGDLYKEYVGSSTHKTNHIEGVAALVKTKGNYISTLTKLLEGIKSGCSYQGVDNLVDLKKNPEFIKITSAGLRESHPHDVDKILK